MTRLLAAVRRALHRHRSGPRIVAADLLALAVVERCRCGHIRVVTRTDHGPAYGPWHTPEQR